MSKNYRIRVRGRGERPVSVEADSFLVLGLTAKQECFVMGSSITIGNIANMLLSDENLRTAAWLAVATMQNAQKEIEEEKTDDAE